METFCGEHQQGSSIEKEDVLGLWVNHYKVTETIDSFDEKVTNRNLVDPVSHTKIEKTTSGDIEFIVIFLYWILLEASALQGSIGKKVMGLQVVNQDGEKPSFFQSVARNLMKILSGVTLCIGFMMAGWTNQRQALHDKIPNLLVVKG